MSIDFNPLAPAVIANPFPHYKELRDKAPVVWMEALQAWAVSRYADVEFALRNPQLFSSSLFTEQALGDLNHVPEVPWLLDMNPPAHTRLRKLANKGFLKRRIRALEPHVKAIATRLVGDLRECSETDLVASFSGPLPTIVIAEMLGVDPERRADFKNWSDDVVVATARPTDPAERARVRASLSEFRVYLEGMIEERRTNPAEDLISALVHAKEENDTLSSSEVLALTSLLLVAGNETTTNLIGNATVALTDRPEEMARVRAAPELAPAVVEETLRFLSPVTTVFRRSVEDVELEGGKIPAGQTVFLFLGAANRDERKFSDPDRFDLDRNPEDHLAFGFGTHFCLGSPLARLEGRCAVEGLFCDAPPFTRASETVRWVESVIVRGPQALRLRFE